MGWRAFIIRLRSLAIACYKLITTGGVKRGDKHPTEIYFLYRTILPHQFEKKTNKPRPPAFHLRHGEQTLSIWDSRYVTPRQLLQNYIDEAIRSAEVGDEEKRKKVENRLRSNGHTPDEMYAKGWRIARLTTATFLSVRLPIGPPRHDGHRDVIGTEQDFVDSADALVENSEILTEQETLG